VPTFVQRPATPHRHHDHTTVLLLVTPHYISKCSVAWLWCAWSLVGRKLALVSRGPLHTNRKHCFFRSRHCYYRVVPVDKLIYRLLNERSNRPRNNKYVPKKDPRHFHLQLKQPSYKFYNFCHKHRLEIRQSE